MMRGMPIVAASIVLLLALAGAGAAQEIRLVEEPALDGRLPVQYRSWTVKKEGASDFKVSQLAVPFFARMPLADRGELSVYIPGVSAKSEGDETSEFSGICDVRLAGSLDLGDGRYRLGAWTGIPTGKANLDEQERAVGAIVANRILGFPVKRFGEGFDVGVGLVRGFAPGRRLSASLGAGYLRKGEYDFLSSETGDVLYKPGDEAFFAAGAGGEGMIGLTNFVWKGDIRYRLFGTDRRNGQDFYEEGDQIDALLDAAFVFPEGHRFDLALFLVFKGDGSEEGAFGEGSLDSLSLERYLMQGMTGNFQELAAAYTHQVAARLGLSGRVSWGNYGEYSSETVEGESRLLGSARVWEVGAGGRYAASPRADLLLNGAYLTGSAEKGAVDLSGFDIVASVRWVF